MSFASTSRLGLAAAPLRTTALRSTSRLLVHRLPRPAVAAALHPRLTGASLRFASSSSGTPSTPLASAQQAAQNARSEQQQQQQEEQEQEEAEEEPEPEPKSFRERMRFLWRRYGWWALGVYQLASIVDISLTFGAIHLLGAEHIRKLEARLRKAAGLGEREMEDHEVAVWPVGEVLPDGTLKAPTGAAADNNSDAARHAAKALQGKADAPAKAVGKSSTGSSSSTLWAEAVLAYTIHKTLLLPFRVMVTAAVTPSFVKKMVQWGWAKPNNLVKVGKLGKGKAKTPGPAAASKTD